MKNKIYLLFALLCASMMTWATDYCHTEMSAGGKTIYLTCQEVSTGNYQLKVECNEAMSGLGGSFCEVNGVGGYQLNAAGHFTLSADGKTITCDIESSSAPRVYTPLYVLIDGEKNFGEISDASWAVCGGSTPEPAEGEKFVAANASINSVYIAPGWAKDAASEATVNYNSSTGTITASILNALGGQWQGQIKLNIGFAYNASKYYDFSIKFHASKAIGGVTLKSNNDNALFYEDQSVNLPADEDYVWTKSDVAGVAGDKIFVFDFGWAAAGTDITISEISIIEKDGPSTPPAPVDPNSYTAGGHTIHLDASFVGDIYTLVITSADDMQGLGGSFWNVNGVGADMRTNTGTSSYTVSGDKKTITCQVQSTSAPNIYTPLYVLMPGEVNFGNVTLNWEDRTPITSEYCNYQDPQTIKGGKNIALTWETDGSGNVIITMQNGIGSSSCSFRNGGFEGGIGAFVVSDDNFVTTTPASNYFTAVQVYSGNTYTLTKIADLPANAKIKHVGSGHALAWVLNGNDEYCYPDFIYTYGGTCNQLDAPTNVAIDANNIITFDAVTGADSYMAYVSLGGVEKYSQAVASGDELTYTALVTGDYIVNVVASGAGKVDSDPSADVVWHLEAAPVVLGNSEYCEHTIGSGNQQAYLTWETDGSGNIVITISEALGGTAADTHFRGNGMALGNFQVGAGKADASTYFNHACGGSNQVTLSLKNPGVAPSLGEKIYFTNKVVEYTTSQNNNAYSNMTFEWTYGTVCSGKAVSATPNNSTMGTAVVKQGDVEVTSVEAGTSVTFIATSADAELYRFVNWTKGGVEVSTSATYVATITETTNLVANFDYVRDGYCHYELLATGGGAVGKKLYMTLGSIGGGKYQIKYEGSAEAPLLGLNNANYVVNGVSTDIEYEDQPTSGNDVPFSKQNGRWSFDATGYGSAKMEFSLAAGKTIDDIYVWENNIYFNTSYGELAYNDNNDRLGLFGMNAAHRHNIDWNSTCSDAEVPVFDKAEAEVLNETSVQLKIQATDNWGGILTYTIARAGAEPIISNHASGEEFTQDVTGLTAGTQYDFTVTVSDGVNNANTHIIVTPEGDNTKPIMGTASLESKTWNSAIINVTASDNKGVTAYYVVEKDADYIATDGKITIDGLTAATVYTFNIKAKDAAGNISDNAAEVTFTTDAHSLVPTTAAPVPTWPDNQVKSLYSDSYDLAPSSTPNYNAPWWSAPAINLSDIDGNNYMDYDLANDGMIGWQYDQISVASMEKLHIDIYASAAGSVSVRPITDGDGALNDNRKSLTLAAQQWNSFDIDLTEFGAHDWTKLFQFSIEYWAAGGLLGEHISVDNVYFYRTSAIVDTEAPTNVSASIAAQGFKSVKLTVSAEDNMGAVNFSVKNGDVEVATGASASGVATTIMVNNLTPGTAYNFTIIAKDDKPNEAAPFAIDAPTKALPAPAPTPDFSGKLVIPVFTDAMAGAPAQIHSGGWGEATIYEWMNLSANDKVFYVQNLNWAGWHSWGADIDATGMQFFHVDVYSIGATSVNVTPISHDPTQEGSYTIELTPNAWTGVDVPLSAYANIEWNKIFQFKFMNPEGGDELMIDNVYFYAEVLAKDVVRDGLSAGKWGTICPKQTVENVEGATFYQISYLEEQGGLPFNMVFDQIPGTTLTAGQPYFFVANGTQILGNKTGAELTVAGDGVNGFYGYISSTDAPMELANWHTDYDANEEYNTFIIYNNSVFRINQGGTMLNSERCYININSTEPSRRVVAPALGLKRLNMCISGTNVTTGLNALNVSDKLTKVIIDGQLYILREGKLYDLTGRMVK